MNAEHIATHLHAYRAPLSAFWRRGIRISRGYGEQMALLLSDWSRDGAPSRADMVQLSLFGQEGGA